jgi:hypothetical protein
LTKREKCDTIFITDRPKGAFLIRRINMINDGYVTEFVTKAKEAGITPQGTARELMAKNTEHFAATLARTLVDVYGLEPWEIARDVFYSRDGLYMSSEAGARALKIGLGLDAAAMALMFHKLAYTSTACKYVLEQLHFSEPEIKKAIKTTYNID